MVVNMYLRNSGLPKMTIEWDKIVNTLLKVYSPSKLMNIKRKIENGETVILTNTISKMEITLTKHEGN